MKCSRYTTLPAELDKIYGILLTNSLFSRVIRRNIFWMIFTPSKLHWNKNFLICFSSKYLWIASTSTDRKDEFHGNHCGLGSSSHLNNNSKLAEVFCEPLNLWFKTCVISENSSASAESWSLLKDSLRYSLAKCSLKTANTVTSKGWKSADACEGKHITRTLLSKNILRRYQRPHWSNIILNDGFLSTDIDITFEGLSLKIPYWCSIAST